MASAIQSCLLILSVAVLATVSGQAVIGRGSCPNTGAKADFDKSQYLGTWYEYERFSNWFELGMVCVRAVYGDVGSGTISVTNAGVREVKIFGQVVYREPKSIEGNATVPDPTKPGELKVSFSPYQGGNKANYFVVDTDYTNYAVVFSCSELPLVPLNIQFAWILTRTRGQAPSNLAELKATLQAAGVNTNKFNLVDQSSCDSPPSR